MSAKENFRIVTNGYEYKVQERLKTFWRGTEYWSDVVEIGAFDEYRRTPIYDKKLDAHKAMTGYIVRMARYFDEWKPAHK